MALKIDLREEVYGHCALKSRPHFNLRAINAYFIHLLATATQTPVAPAWYKNLKNRNSEKSYKGHIVQIFIFILFYYFARISKIIPSQPQQVVDPAAQCPPVLRAREQSLFMNPQQTAVKYPHRLSDSWLRSALRESAQILQVKPC